MDEREFLAQEFEEHRTRLRAVAYRMLGSLSEADDAVQEAWLRLNRSDAREVENLGAWLTTVVGRVSLNMLRSRANRREQPLGVHLHLRAGRARHQAGTDQRRGRRGHDAGRASRSRSEGTKRTNRRDGLARRPGATPRARPDDPRLTYSNSPADRNASA